MIKKKNKSKIQFLFLVWMRNSDLRAGKKKNLRLIFYHLCHLFLLDILMCNVPCEKYLCQIFDYSNTAQAKLKNPSSFAEIVKPFTRLYPLQFISLENWKWKAKLQDAESATLQAIFHPRTIFYLLPTFSQW